MRIVGPKWIRAIDLFRVKGAGRLYVRCKGGNDEVGGHGWKIGTQAALVPAFAKPAKVGQPRSQAKKGKVKIPILKSQNKTKDGMGLFPRR
jgi:hypothetical protein